MSFLVELPLEAYADHLFDDFAPDAGFPDRHGARAHVDVAACLRGPRCTAQGQAGAGTLGPATGRADQPREDGPGCRCRAHAASSPRAAAQQSRHLPEPTPPPSPTGSPISISARGRVTSIADLRRRVARGLERSSAALTSDARRSRSSSPVIARRRARRHRRRAPAARVEDPGIRRLHIRRAARRFGGFADSYNASGLGDRSFRLIHGLDIVPTLPPSALGFRHAGRLIACESRRPLYRRRDAYPCAIATIRRFSTRSSAGLLATITGFCHRLVPAVVTHGWLGHYQKYVLPPPLHRTICRNAIAARSSPT